VKSSARIDTVELSTRGVAGHALRRVQKLNNTLRGTRQLVAKSGEDPAQSIALLLAQTRVLVLKMGRREFGNAAGMHFHAVKNVETPGSHPQHESFSRVYRTWFRFARSEKGPFLPVRGQVAKACEKLLEFLVPQRDEHGRPLRETIDGLYRKWMYQAGHEAFEAASKLANPLHVPLTYGALWQRREVGMVPDFDEVRSIGTRLRLDLDEAAAIWEQCKTRQLLERGLPSPLVRFIVTMQLKCSGLRMTAASVREHLRVSEKTAQAINNGQLVKFKDVRNAVQSILDSKSAAALERDWQSAWERNRSQEDFGTALPRICAENGWSNHTLAVLLRIRPPEERGIAAAARGKARLRAESYRPSAEIRRMYQEKCFSGQAPAKAVIDMVALEGKREASGENQRHYLTRLFLEGVERQLSRKGTAAHDSPLRWHRILCGVTPRQLADASGISKDHLLLVERGSRKISAAELKRLLNLIESFPAEKVKQARARLTELKSPPENARQAVERLRDRHGGYNPLCRLLNDDPERQVSFTPVRLKRIAGGAEVPPLPMLERMLIRGGSQIVPALIDDWYQRVPEYLRNHPKLRWKHPLVRGFGVVVFEKWLSLRHFWDDQFRDDFSYSIITRNFQQLNGNGADYHWATVSRYLNAAGMDAADPRRAFLQQLFDRRGEVTDAVRANQRSRIIQIVGEVLRQWRKSERTAGRDPRPTERLLGLTAEERNAASKQ
jgi:transcriptional regulator with XRE-family HTH domain